MVAAKALLNQLTALTSLLPPGETSTLDGLPLHFTIITTF